MGAAFSFYAATCFSKLNRNMISAFATHSNGLKIKGDGNEMPKIGLNQEDGKYSED
jgi:hypothetical protein